MGSYTSSPILNEINLFSFEPISIIHYHFSLSLPANFPREVECTWWFLFIVFYSLLKSLWTSYWNTSLSFVKVTRNLYIATYNGPFSVFMLLDLSAVINEQWLTPSYVLHCLHLVSRKQYFPPFFPLMSWYFVILFDGLSSFSHSDVSQTLLALFSPLISWRSPPSHWF